MSLPRPASEPLPLTTWQQIWRKPVRRVLGALLFAEVSARVWERSQALFWLDLALGFAAMVLLQWRRRFPVAVAVVIGAVGVLSTSAAGAAVVAWSLCRRTGDDGRSSRSRCSASSPGSPTSRSNQRTTRLGGSCWHSMSSASV